jgi:hypothetical protein
MADQLWTTNWNGCGNRLGDPIYSAVLALAWKIKWQSRITVTVPDMRLTSWTNFVPDCVRFLCYRFYSVFLIIFFRSEALLEPVSDFPDEEKITRVLRIMQSTVKMQVRSKQKHDCDVGINWIVISLLSPSSNRPRKKLHFHYRHEGEVSKISVRIACLKVRLATEPFRIRCLSGTYSITVFGTRDYTISLTWQHGI